MKKYLKIAIILIILGIFYLYIANITLIPKKYNTSTRRKIRTCNFVGNKLKTNSDK